FLFFNSCYSGGMQGTLDELENENTIFLAAVATSNQIAQLDDSKDNGCWTQCFLSNTWLGYQVGHGFNGAINTDLNNIFWDGSDLYKEHKDDNIHWYSEYKSPWLFNPSEQAFYLSNYGI
ncbi:MAG: hypothetical protein ACTSX6_11795, partial [Candidatus Heimdallarchaeaceae archaeon]